MEKIEGIKLEVFLEYYASKLINSLDMSLERNYKHSYNSKQKNNEEKLSLHFSNEKLKHRIIKELKKFVLLEEKLVR